MELSNSFTVDVPVDTAWQVLSDVPTIAPCLPGAQLQEVEGDEYRGIVKVKVGPIQAQYKGAATFVERDESARRMVLRAEGRETRGQGKANATITAVLRDLDGRTEVVVDTDLTVTGKVAQMGRGVMADVSGKLMGQFAENLAATVLADSAAADRTPAPAGGTASNGGSGGGTGSPSDSGTASGPDNEAAGEAGNEAGNEAAGEADGDGQPAVRRLDLPEPEPVDLVAAAGGPAMKRVIGPVIGGLIVVLLIRLLVRRRRGA